MFWNSYPRKVGKVDAEKAWGKIKNPSDVVQEVLAALEWQKESPQWTKNDGEYIPHPASYLNKKRWLDEREQKPHQQPKQERYMTVEEEAMYRATMERHGML